jgi:uncharacterized protein YodC (DUF2158 family)
MSENSLQIGDIVRMKSGGPAMTVTTVNYDREPPEACCMWFERRGRPHFYYLRVGALELAKPDSKKRWSRPR